MLAGKTVESQAGPRFIILMVYVPQLGELVVVDLCRP